MLDLIRHNCAVFAIYGVKNAAKYVREGLYALQHRGQDGGSIVSCDGDKYHEHRGLGLILSIFKDEVIERLPGHFAIGHGRYSTKGANIEINLQPHWATIVIEGKREEKIWLASNGDLTNMEELKDFLKKQGKLYDLYSENDSEVFAKLVAYHFNQTQDMAKAISLAINQAIGAYSAVMLALNKLFVFTDGLKIRPLALGRIGEEVWVVASETCAFDIIGAKYIREVFTGEIIEIDEKGLKVLNRLTDGKSANCIFEFIYFARPDSMVYGESVSRIRDGLGWRLYKEHPAPINSLVIPVPDSSNSAALSYYARATNDSIWRWITGNKEMVLDVLSNPGGDKPEIKRIMFGIGLVRSHYVQRTFIEPEQEIRDLDARLKFNPDQAVLRDGIIVVVDDSIVRGTTSKKLVRMLRSAGAKEVHYRVSSPPLTSPCFYGIDMPTKEEFVAHNRSIEQIKAYLEVDSLGYLSLEGLLSCVPNPENFCTACFTGKYPTEIPACKLKS